MIGPRRKSALPGVYVVLLSIEVLTVCVWPAFIRLYPARAAATREKGGAVV